MKRMPNCSQRRTRRGFSLIELLIVLAILVLLASLVAPRLLGSRDKANIDATKTQISLFKSTLEMYSLHMGSYPSSEQGLKALVERPSGKSLASGGEDDDFGGDGLDIGGGDELGGGDEDLSGFGDDEGDDLEEEDNGGASSNWQGPYLKGKLPKDPWGSSYRYEFPSRNNDFGEPDIWSVGPDRKDNTDDDITSWGSSKRKTGGGDSEDEVDGFDVGGDDAGGTEDIDLGE